MKNAIISIKGAGRKANGSPWLLVNQKSNQLLWGAAVAFLILTSLTGLQDTDQCDDNTDDRHYNTRDTYDCFRYHILYLSLLFSICITSSNTYPGSSQNVLILAKGEPLTV